MCSLIIGVCALLLLPAMLLLRLVCKRPAWRRTVSTAKATDKPGVGWTEEFLYGSQRAESEFINQAVTDINTVQRTNKRKNGCPVKRGFHAKMHAGITNCQFSVAADIPAQLQVGFLQPGKQYDAMLRLSNASGVIQADTAHDLHGLAVRITDDAGAAHDFLGTSAAASHTRDAVQFMEFAKASSGSKLLLIPRLIWAFGLRETLRMLKTASGQVKRPVVSLCMERYWSRAPYAFGDTAVKFIWAPTADAAMSSPGPSYLREELVERLKQGPVTFDLQVQLWVSDVLTPIEDNAIEWKESDAPPITIGRLTIPQQDLNSADALAANALVEQELFSPWNTTPEFRPLGSQNRARKWVYKSSADLRNLTSQLTENGCPMNTEPVQPPDAKCPFKGGLWRPKSKREGIGPYKYVYWNAFYVLMEYLNRKLARNPNRKVSWDQWPPLLGVLYLMSKLRFNRSNAITDPYDYAANDSKPPVAEPADASRYIAADGSYVSDENNGQMGAACTRFGSNIPPQKVRPDIEMMTPSARDVGKLRWRRIDPDTGKEIVVPALIGNDLMGAWIQFEFHGFGGNTMRDPVSDNPHKMPRRPSDNWPGDEALIDRTSKDPTRVTDNGRPTVINEKVQAWVQGQLYGNNEGEVAQLRSFKGGKLELDENGMLPEDPRKPGVDRTGFNNNYNPELSLLHWLFSVEHNAIADHYSYFHPDWDDEQLFQMARKANCAQISRIHTIQWTEDLLQHPTLQLGMHADWYGFLGQRLKMYLTRLSHRHPWVRRALTPFRNNDLLWGMPGSKWEHHEGPFQVPKHFRVVYRLHEMILGEHEIVDPNTGRTIDRVGLIDFVHHNTRPMVEKFGYDTLAWSFVSKSCGALTLHNFPRALTQFNNMQDNTLTDLAERDIFRERTDGTGTYNEFRLSVGEPPVTSFLELTGGDVELAKEIEIKYEGEIDKVDLGIGILAEPKPAGFALGFCQFYQFVLNAPRRVKSNRHLSEGYSYDGYAEGLDWVEHGGGMGGVMRRHLPGLRSQLEGVTRYFTPWPNIETFPLRMLTKTHDDTAKVFRSDLRTLALGAIASGAAVWAGAMTWWIAALIIGALFTGSAVLGITRMLAMRFMQVVWKKCYTDKRGFMFGTMYRAEKRINRAATGGRLGSLAVMAGGLYFAIHMFSAHPVVAALFALTALSALSINKWSKLFALDAQVLKISLRNRMREGLPTIPRDSVPTFDVDRQELERVFRTYAPGREYLTSYDFARYHEGERLADAAEGKGNGLTRQLAQWCANRRSNTILRDYADCIVEEDRHLVPAISKDMLVRYYEGLAQRDLKREHDEGDRDPSPVR